MLSYLIWMLVRYDTCEKTDLTKYIQVEFNNMQCLSWVHIYIQYLLIVSWLKIDRLSIWFYVPKFAVITSYSKLLDLSKAFDFDEIFISFYVPSFAVITCYCKNRKFSSDKFHWLVYAIILAHLIVTIQHQFFSISLLKLLNIGGF